jgi:hypothetical protein
MRGIDDEKKAQAVPRHPALAFSFRMEGGSSEPTTGVNCMPE